MTHVVTLPSLGDAVTSATVSAWLKAVGDTVTLGEPLVEVSTDKVDTEIEAPATGTLLEIRVAEDDVVGIGDVIAVIGLDASSTPPVPAPVVPAPVTRSLSSRHRPRRSRPHPRPLRRERPAPGCVGRRRASRGCAGPSRTGWSSRCRSRRSSPRSSRST